MSPLVFKSLILHIFLGLTGIMAQTAFLLTLAQKEWLNRWLRFYSLLAVVMFIGSALTGGFYYLTYYGQTVRPIIKSGQYPWVHNLIMETKEHLFLFLPFLSFVVFLTVNFGIKEFETNEKLKKTLMALTITSLTIGLLITLSGMAISGAVVKK